MGQNPQVIKQRNERAREELAHDINELGDKLNVKKQVGHVKNELVVKVKDKIGMSHTDTRGSSGNPMLGAMKDNPVAALAFGFGATKLLTGWKRRQHTTSYPNTMSRGTVSGGYRATNAPDTYRYDGNGGDASVKDRVGDKASDVASSVKHNASDMKDSAALKAMEAKDSVADSVSGVVDHVPSDLEQWNRTIRQNLPAFGIAAFAAGAVAGLLAPKTHFEADKFGDMRENLIDTAREKTAQVKDAVSHSVEQGVESAKDQFSDDVKGDQSTTKLTPTSTSPGSAMSSPGNTLR